MFISAVMSLLSCSSTMIWIYPTLLLAGRSRLGRVTTKTTSTLAGATFDLLLMMIHDGSLRRPMHWKFRRYEPWLFAILMVCACMDGKSDEKLQNKNQSLCFFFVSYPCSFLFSINQTVTDTVSRSERVDEEMGIMKRCTFVCVLVCFCVCFLCGSEDFARTSAVFKCQSSKGTKGK